MNTQADQLPHQVSVRRIGLRSYDIALGFRNLNERSGLLAEFQNTHETGLAAILAGAIKGKDIVTNVHALKLIAAEVLKINPWAFEKILIELADLELIRDVVYGQSGIASFSEQIPLFYEGLHQRLGEGWQAKGPSELEQQLITGLDLIARTPLLGDAFNDFLGLDIGAASRLRAVGEAAQLARRHVLSDGSELIISPLYAFEQPDAIVTLLESVSGDRIVEAFSRVRQQPGFPVKLDGSDPVVEEMIRSGLFQAPAVVGADRQQRAFVVIPYGLEPEYLTTKKQILDRALALVACVRCGEISGGASNIRLPDRLLAALANPARDYTLGAHSSTDRQYAVLIKLGVISTVVQGDRRAARLVPTDDNFEAVRLARTLLQRGGDGAPERGSEREAAALLYTGDDFLAPIETIRVAQESGPRLTTRDVSHLWEQIAGWRE